jgi:hypothetical protein
MRNRKESFSRLNRALGWQWKRCGENTNHNWSQNNRQQQIRTMPRRGVGLVVDMEQQRLPLAEVFLAQTSLAPHLNQRLLSHLFDQVRLNLLRHLKKRLPV